MVAEQAAASQRQHSFEAPSPSAWKQASEGAQSAPGAWLRDPPRATGAALVALAAAAAKMPLDGDRVFCSPDSVLRRIAAGEAVSVRELPAPRRRPALSTHGFAPANYPARPRDAPASLDAPGFFDKLAPSMANQPEPLFFAFYFQPGTMQQLAAVAALHSLNWRFHTAHKLWFQWPVSHHAAQRVLTSTFEEGLFRFWDKDSWCMRDTQPDFKFDFLYLQ
ncbi:hypothetical protein WJX81_007952 [Elliptochloris bilobata]|uniref:NOT2/NOT3/NOT5 C-terminal domain-containing protein n=1 Tax=Elliptochloris bilobata TaxID=381761 RepID=A0AAW1REQ3_9CHLO